MSQTFRGRCLCGAVTFSAALANADVSACHCGMCRRWSSGPVMTVEHEGSIELSGAENLGVYASSEFLERTFCKVCGSALFTKLIGEEHYWLSVGALEPQGRFTFTQEDFIDEKPDYYVFANDTKKRTGAEFLAAFTDAEEKS